MALHEGNEGIAGWIASAVVGAIVGLWAIMRKITNPGEPCRKDMEDFKKEVRKDLDAIKTSLDDAKKHAEVAHDRFTEQVAGLRTDVAVLDSRLSNLHGFCESISRRVDAKGKP